jgi:hypothetical protein
MPLYPKMTDQDVLDAIEGLRRVLSFHIRRPSKSKKSRSRD